jgi:hypothetical protein
MLWKQRNDGISNEILETKNERKAKMAKLTKQMLERAQTLLGNRREQLHAAWKQKNPKPESTELSLMGALKIALKDKSFNAKLLKAAAAEDALGRSYPAITVTVLCEWFPAVAAAYH